MDALWPRDLRSPLQLRTLQAGRPGATQRLARALTDPSPLATSIAAAQAARTNSFVERQRKQCRGGPPCQAPIVSGGDDPLAGPLHADVGVSDDNPFFVDVVGRARPAAAAARAQARGGAPSVLQRLIDAVRPGVDALPAYDHRA